MAKIDEDYERKRAGASDSSHPSRPNQPTQATVAVELMANLLPDPWRELKSFTPARIALGRAGSSLPTQEILNFGLAHALARDAIYHSLDLDALKVAVGTLDWSTLSVHSQASNRQNYLLRPDLGRQLDNESVAHLKSVATTDGVDLLIVIADGLSSLAIERHAVPLLSALQPLIPKNWRLGPVVMASQARVALADQIAETLNARLVVMLIGERPGLSFPDSLGIYLTYGAKRGCTNAERNCISNVHQAGLSYADAANKLIWLATEAMHQKTSGVALKDNSDDQDVLLEVK
jgi:ethanolamine ammonia-lyase small subunit